MSRVSIEYHGLEVDVYYDYLPAEEENGLSERVEIYKIEYGGCDVLDVIVACGKLVWISELVWEERDKE